WKYIPHSDYERHMSDPSVGQSKVLAQIFRDQITAFTPAVVTIFGIGAGDGLDVLDPSVTKKVTGIDVNGEYLNLCAERYSSRGYRLHLIETDVNTGFITMSPSDMVIANLFLEYVEREKFHSVIRHCAHAGTIISVTIQQNNGESFVSQTKIPTLNGLARYHRDVDKEDLIASMNANGCMLLGVKKYGLPGKKEFLRCDFAVK
ncbi:MAG: class I SAM-dependent methyltransferase, partial [Bacteroidota bacterium]